MKRLVLIGPLALLFMSLISPAQAANGLVNKTALPSLMIGPKDIPWDVILWDFNKSYATKTPSTDKYDSPLNALLPPYKRRMIQYSKAHATIMAAYTQRWYGPPIADQHRFSYSIEINVYISPSSTDAALLTQSIVNSMSVITPESYDKKYRAFADRAWPHSGIALSGIRFCRRNVTVDMHIGYLGKDVTGEVIRICGLLSRKIDAAANGHPEPVPALPLINENVHIYWHYPSVNKMLTMPAKNTIVLKCFDREPITVFARKLPGSDYMVSLNAIALAIGDIKYIKSELNTGKAVIKGKPMIFTDGSSIVNIGKNKLDLAYPVEISVGKSINFPVSFIEKISGKHLTWKQNNKIMVGTIK